MSQQRINRRTLIGLLGRGAGLASSPLWPLAARAQQPMPVVGFLNSAAPGGWAPYLTGFRNGLKEAGFVEGDNVAIEYRWAESQNDRLPTLAADLVRRQVTVIASTDAASTLAAKAATASIPIVFEIAADPVALGLVASLNRPGGNLTGIVSLNVQLAAKRLEMLHEFVPAATAVALLVNPASPVIAETQSRDLQAAARTLGLELHVLNASSTGEIDAAFATMRELRAGALVIGTDPFFNTRSEQLATLALRHAIPAIFQSREFAVAGGLMSYASSLTDMYRQAGAYTGRILKGERPAELPVQQSAKVEFIVNLKTARALGLTVPLPLIGRTEEVIE